jgi:hypothetical protein
VAFLFALPAEDAVAIDALPNTATAEDAVAVFAEVHAEGVAALMAEPTGPVRQSLRGYGSAYDRRPRSGPADDRKGGR